MRPPEFCMPESELSELIFRVIRMEKLKTWNLHLYIVFAG